MKKAITVLKKALCIVLAVTAILSASPLMNLLGAEPSDSAFAQQASAASPVKSWTINSVTNLTQTDAQIKAKINFTKKMKITQVGFYFGTAKDKLTKNAKYDKVSYNSSELEMWFLMSKYGQKLQPGKTYYYRFYAIANGNEYKSEIKSFTTPGATTVSWQFSNVENLTQTDAQIKAKVNFTKKVKITQVGFYFGTAKDKLTKNAKYDTVNYNRADLDMWFLMSKYGQKLQPGKTYYYRFYAIANGNEYKSEIKSFTTTEKTQASVLTWPVPDRRDVKYITQGFHKGSIDISGSGHNVVAACGDALAKVYTCSKNHTPSGDGKGTSASCCYGAGNGLIIKGTDGRYYRYSHMQAGSIPSALRKTGATVRQGQVIGKVGNTGYSFGAHLHFNITTKSNLSDKNGWTDPLQETYEGIDVGYFKTLSVSDITKNNATITAEMVYTNVSKVGFRIGTTESNMKEYTETINDSIKKFWYPLQKWCGSLKSQTKYYYQFYIVINGEKIYSDVKSFTTK